MRNKVDACIVKTKESNIKFEENQRKIIFQNPSRLVYQKVDVDGCTYIISTNVAPAFTTYIQMKAKSFKDKFKALLVVREKQLTVALY